MVNVWWRFYCHIVEERNFINVKNLAIVKKHSKKRFLVPCVNF